MRNPIFLQLVLIAIYSRLFEGDVILASGQCLSDQQALLLLNLKTSLVFNPSRSTKLVKWNQSSDSWDGVTCEDGHVTGLDLSNESISGGINHPPSSSLFGLHYLQRLNLAFNAFSSSQIPPQFGNFSYLVYLNLSNAGFAGQIPTSLSGLTNLVTLDLSMLYFPGTDSLRLVNPNLKMLVANLKELRELYLDGVNISAPGTEWCQALSSSSSLPNLQVLSMSNCDLSGPIDPSLTNLKSLSVIQIGNNNLSTRVPDFFANFPNLTSLRLSSTGLYGVFPGKIFQVPTLQSIDLSNNLQLHGSLPEFPRGSSLQTVVLSLTNFSGTLPNSIGLLHNLSRVELANCSFMGQIPSSIGNLSGLVYLDFSNNNLTGPIPSFTMSKNLTHIILSHNDLTGQISASHWENLQNLDLRYNSLEGNIPPSLLALPMIQKIQLSNNRFSGQVQPPNGSLNFSSYHLDTLDLSSNRLEGLFPVALLDIRELKYVSLSFNKFNGSLNIDIFQKLRNLSVLDLSYNNLTINAAAATASALGAFPKLSTLKLALCRLRTLPDFLSDQTKLIYLDLSYNQIEGTIPTWIGNLGDLLYLNLSYNLLDDTKMALHNLSDTLNILDLRANKIQGPIPPFPGSLTYVDFSSNNLSSIIPEDIGQNLSFAIFFSLSNNTLHGSVPESICRTIYLQVLDLSRNNLTGTIPKCLTIGSFKVVNLRNNRLVGIIPDNFSTNCGLRTLDLGGNQLSGQLPNSLCNCTMLEVLDIGNNQLDGSFPCHMKNTTKLRVLVLRSNRFSGQIGCNNVNITWSLLQIVDLANNSFTVLPPEEVLATWPAMQENFVMDHLKYPFLGLSGLYYQDMVTITIKGLKLELEKILTVFTSIDLSGNRINGSIPNVLGTFKGLRSLNLSRNMLSGPIPLSISNLQVLECLDLSDNHLSGNIPPQLTDLNFLSFLNLSYNRLAGRIPHGKQFFTFENTSYEGNNDLCGPPLSRSCSSTATNKSGPKKPEEGAEFDWGFMVTGLGFGAGAAVVVAPLTVLKKGRGWCDDNINRFLLVVLPMLGFTYTVMDYGNGSREDDMEDGDGDDNYDTDKLEESCGLYCVFCTKLDSSMKEVIHNPMCTCCYSQHNSSPSSSSSSSTVLISTGRVAESGERWSH